MIHRSSNGKTKGENNEQMFKRLERESDINSTKELEKYKESIKRELKRHDQFIHPKSFVGPRRRAQHLFYKN